MEGDLNAHDSDSNGDSDVDVLAPSSDSSTAQVVPSTDSDENEVIPCPEELLKKGAYLFEYPSWLCFIGEESRSKYSVHFVSRNDKIWELLATECRYLDVLVMIRDVYLKAFPPKSTYSSSTTTVGQDELFPPLDDVIAEHTRLFYYMFKRHNEHEDRVISQLGECFVKSFQPETLEIFVQAYGAFMFVQSSLSERLINLRSQASKAELLMECERDPRSKRRTVNDCYLIIVQRWTKIETLISSIMSDTIATDGTNELDNLEIARTSVQSILLDAQQLMTDLVHADKLRYFADHLKDDFFDLTSGSDRTLKQWMTAPDAKLINYDKVTVQSKKENGKIVPVEAWAIALKDCFFLLSEIAETKEYIIYTKMQMPTILIWTKHFGYFRDDAKATLTFYIIMEGDKPSLESFGCATHDEVTRWQKVFSTGFANFGSQKEAEEREKQIEESVALVRKLDTEISQIWCKRNKIFSLLLNDGRRHQQLQPKTPGDGRNMNRTGSISVGSESRPTSGLYKSESGHSDDFGYYTRNNYSDSPIENEEAINQLYNRFLENLQILGTCMVSPYPSTLSRSASDAADRRNSVLLENPKKQRDIGAKLDRRSQRISSTFSSLMRPSKNKLDSSRRCDMPPPVSGYNPLVPTVEIPDNLPIGNNHNTAPLSSSELSSATSESSLSTLPSSVMNLIDDINTLAEKLFNSWCVQRTQLKYLETKPSSAKDSFSSIGKQERETLRLQQKKLEEERKEWNAKKQKEDAKLERENQKLIKWANELKEQQLKFEEEKKTRQIQDDMRAMAAPNKPLPYGHASPGLASSKEFKPVGRRELPFKQIPIQYSQTDLERRVTTGVDSSALHGGRASLAMQGKCPSNEALNCRPPARPLNQPENSSSIHPPLTSRSLTSYELLANSSGSMSNQQQLPPASTLNELSGRLASKKKVKSGSIKKTHLLGGNH